MPRPGPRPYECIRRAWHSDAHQPLRGKLTQEILTVVTDLHKPETRRKREWQEKLPIVVLRAEEILYSKAKSEAEYMDVKTLRERLDDAVDTMIRRTDASKEGPYMQPCVEAALSLGCFPKSFPRGQRVGARHTYGNSKRAGSSSSATSAPSSADFPAPFHRQDYHSQDVEISSGGIIQPNLRTWGHCTAGEFASPSQYEHFIDKISFQVAATTGQDSVTMADLPTSISADVFTPYPFLCVSSRTNGWPSPLPLNASLSSNSLPGSLPPLPAVTAEGSRPFTGNLHFPSPFFVNMVRHNPVPVAVHGEAGRSSSAGTLRMLSANSVLTELNAAGSRTEDGVVAEKNASSAVAACAVEIEDLQLRLAPPGSFASFASPSSEFSNSGSCITHTPAHLREKANRVSNLSGMDPGDGHLYNAFSSSFPAIFNLTPASEVGKNYLNTGAAYSDAKRPRLCKTPSPKSVSDK